MKISFVQPRPELQPYIAALWVFESDVGMPRAQQSIAAPNGCPKLIIPYENTLESIANGRYQVTREQGLYFSGNRDSSTLVYSCPRRTGFIGIEFAPHGAFPIFGIPMQETIDTHLDSEVVFGRWGREVREALRNLEGVSHKLKYIQEQLVVPLQRKQLQNGVVDFCVRTLELSDGLVPVKELERKTGFTRQHLDQLFKRHVGLPPKTLAAIFRFQKFYRKWARGLAFEALKEELYGFYYDQSHFTKEFKRMTGYSPRKFTLEVPNEFGRRLLLK